MLSVPDFLIVEDELLIAEMTSEILIKAGHINIRTVDSVEDAIKEIKKCRPTLILTDIALGKEKTGIDLGQLLHDTYHIPFIYVSSHASPEIVGKAKHTRPNAYIVKPFKNEDLLVAIELALFNTTDQKQEPGEEIVVKEGRAMIRLNCNVIKWLETEGNYITINLQDNKRRVVRIPLSELQEQLPGNQFIRIHKSYIINRKHVSEFKTDHILIDKKELPIGRAYRQSVIDFFK